MNWIMVYLNPNRNLGMQGNELNHGISEPQQNYLYPEKWIESWYIWTPTEIFVSREMNWIIVYLNHTKNLCIQRIESNHDTTKIFFLAFNTNLSAISWQETSFVMMRWWWGPLCTRPKQMDFHSASSLKQQSAGRHVTLLWHIITSLKQHSVGRHVTLLWHIISSLKQQSAGRHVTLLWHIISSLKQQSAGRHVTLLWHIISSLKQQSAGRHVTLLWHIISSLKQ